jgi:hypothetical protein
MAKKRTAKAGRKAARRTGSRKAPRKLARGGGRRAKSAPSGPVPVKTGRGAGAAEIGREVVEGFNAGRPDHDLWNRWWSPRAVSVEGGRTSMAWNGRKGMDLKMAWWTENFTVHSGRAEGPFVGATGFSVKYRIDFEEKATGKREVMDEIGVYTVQDGKIVREEFYAGSRSESAAAAGEEIVATAEV